MVYMKKQFSVSVISAEETRSIRFRVLWPHKSSAEECVIDADHSDGAYHIGAFDENKQLVGVCSLFNQRSDRHPGALPDTDSVYRLRVMGTTPEVRGKGAGAAIIEFACTWCQEQDVKWLWCDALEVAFGFYERMGFECLSEMYQVPQIGPHQMMARKF